MTPSCCKITTGSELSFIFASYVSVAVKLSRWQKNVLGWDFHVDVKSVCGTSSACVHWCLVQMCVKTRQRIMLCEWSLIAHICKVCVRWVCTLLHCYSFVMKWRQRDRSIHHAAFNSHCRRDWNRAEFLNRKFSTCPSLGEVFCLSVCIDCLFGGSWPVLQSTAQSLSSVD